MPVAVAEASSDKSTLRHVNIPASICSAASGTTSNSGTTRNSAVSIEESAAAMTRLGVEQSDQGLEKEEKSWRSVVKPIDQEWDEEFLGDHNHNPDDSESSSTMSRALHARSTDPWELDSVFAVEVKSPNDHLSRWQALWLELLAKAGVPIEILRVQFPEP